MKIHREGDFDAARAIYQQVLDDHPRYGDALHLMGMLEVEQGDMARAAEWIGKAVEAQPDEAMFHNNLGNVCIERGLYDEAKASYVRALQLEPGRLDARNNLGVLLSTRGNAEDAEKLLKAVVDVAPSFAGARNNLANHYLRNERLDDAVRMCMDGLIVAPNNGALRHTLVLAYNLLGRTTEAVAVCRAWVEAEPDNPMAAFHLRACLGEDPPDRAPDAYVRYVFDGFANSFDAKLAELSYRAPALVLEAVERHAGPPTASLDILDAGCGTGLCALLLTPWASRLVGVDLSKGMLRNAKARDLYTELICAELVSYLDEKPKAFDLVVSADTLCYFGALEAFAVAARQSLRTDGLLVFTVEAHADVDSEPGHRLNGNGRYSHRRSYVGSTLAEAGFTALDLRAVVLRTEFGKPVDGWLITARAGRGA